MAEGRSIQRLIARAIASERPVAVDASAVLEFLINPGDSAQFVQQMFEDERLSILLSTVTISESLVRPARRNDLDGVIAIKRSLEQRPRTIVVPFDGEQAIETAIVRAQTNLKLPDSAVIAAARTHRAIGIVGADRKWLTRELGVPFYYLPDIQEAERG